MIKSATSKTPHGILSLELGFCSPQDESVRVEGLAGLGVGCWDLGFPARGISRPGDLGFQT